MPAWTLAASIVAVTAVAAATVAGAIRRAERLAGELAELRRADRLAGELAESRRATEQAEIAAAEAREQLAKATAARMPDLGPNATRIMARVRALQALVDESDAEYAANTEIGSVGAIVTELISLGVTEDATLDALRAMWVDNYNDHTRQDLRVALGQLAEITAGTTIDDVEF